MSHNPDSLLRRKEAAAALSEAGFPTSSATLASMATRGGGPPFEYYSRFPLYRWGPTLAWAMARLSQPVANTSERRLSTHAEPLLIAAGRSRPPRAP
jgi:hypothetical protein